MRFVITGSGGCACTPKPLCQCNICVEAREKGFPYKRCGCSLYLEDIALLIDTPEDIAIANPQYTLDINKAKESIEKISNYDIEIIICYHGGSYTKDIQRSLKSICS